MTSARTRPLRTVVAGTNFGRFYLDAVRAHSAFTLVGILSTGSRQSRELAARLDVPCHTSVHDLPADLDAACVVVPSAVMGGGGTELARTLLERDVHVLQEHPVHPDELTASLRLARARKRQYRVNTHYPHVESVRRFIAAATELRRQRRVLFVDAASPVHVLAPLIDILVRALGGVRPWRLGAPDPVAEEVASAAGGTAPLRSLHGVLAGVPLTLRVQNQLHPGDRDNHSLFWHRITIGTDAGVLTLADTHGPVLWHPRLHSPRDAEHRLVFEAGPGAENLLLPSAALLGGSEPGPRFDEIFARWWPEAVGDALSSFAEAIDGQADPLRQAQQSLAVFGIWRDLMARLGPPELIRPAAPVPLAAEALGSEVAVSAGRPARTSPRGEVGASGSEQDDAPGAGYSDAAEFFDLGAREHTARTGAAVVAALAGLDPTAGPLLDIGAGTGLVTRQIAAAFPTCQVIAAEPAAEMRAVLAGRIGDDPALASRVTVLPHAAGDLPLPDRVSGVVACGVLGHLDAPHRRALLRELAARLAPGAPLVVELTGLHTPTVLAPTRMRQATLGSLRYEWWLAGEPSGERRMRLDTTWRVFDGDELVRESRSHYHWYTIDLPTIAEESGLVLHRLPAPHREAVPHLGVLRGAERPPFTR